MLLRCSTGLDHIELSISFLGIFLHSLKSPLKAFKMSLASIQAKTPHFLGYPSIPAHPIALVYEVPCHILRSPLHSQLLTYPSLFPASGPLHILCALFPSAFDIIHHMFSFLLSFLF